MAARTEPSSVYLDTSGTVITDVTICFCSTHESPSNCEQCALDGRNWHRKEKDLYLHSAKQSAWLHVAQTKETDLRPDDLVLTDIRVGEPANGDDKSWENRAADIWVRRSSYDGDIQQAVTHIDVLFGSDAVDPRPQWRIMEASLQLKAKPEVPVARLSILKGRSHAKPSGHRPVLRARLDGTFKILQISDTHMVTGVGVCKDAIDGEGRALPASEADPLTVNFLGKILDEEKPDLVILTGDQLHHDIPDSQSALFKVVAPLIERSIPWAAVFGNHDSEGSYALSREAQMRILEDLPFSLCQSGPESIDGVGNYYLQIMAPAPSQTSLSTLYLLDSHGQIASKIHNPDYDPIKQSQIDWFTSTSQRLKKEHDGDGNHLSLAFLHIPVPEYGDRSLITRGGKRREPTEGPSFNSHFYDALIREDISALACGHDHVNDFCALLPRKQDDPLQDASHLGPWLCYGGGSGFGGYCSYGRKRFHRRTRVWEIDTSCGDLKTYKRLEYSEEKIDELVLVEGGKVVCPPDEANENIGLGSLLRECVVN
ncbi:purple acid phosphatase [Cadophora gregata]|uniref:purple acid phosphatase n=1 Tax=Cadophora gregata TaxID=51156 RepID=UPI0026DD0E57|nr:purple acid phosphatase [Cadophora gregata]KAK0111482.1 purple acid phosphatase [Cadophora gregata]KAK0112042.1 purple acid phosphatase [Cadophora gregata f. sp. sojae]